MNVFNTNEEKKPGDLLKRRNRRQLIQKIVVLLGAAVLAVGCTVIVISVNHNTKKKKEAKAASESAAAETSEETRQETTQETTEEITSLPPPTETTTETETEIITTAETVPTETQVPDESCKIVMIGDMLMHAGISNEAYQEDGTRNYSWLFYTIWSEVQNADVAILNNEVIFGGNEYGAKGFPDFNVFTELGDAEAAAGFDIVLSATNHTMDMGESGVFNTLNFWKNNYPEIIAAGIHESQEDQDTLEIIERNGIRIAVYNCTLHLNSYSLPEDKPYLVDLMNEWSLNRMADYLDRAEAEADFTIVCPHWGTEYELKHNAEQENYAKFFTEHGADLIIGTHPHCLQDIQWITADNGRTSLCYYSIGNYVSHQDKTITMVEGMPIVTITKSGSDAYISDYSIRFLVNWFDKDFTETRIYWLSDYTEELAASHWLNTSEDSVDSTNSIYPMTLNGIRQVITDSVGEQYLY